MLRPVVAVADARRVAGARQAVTGTVDAPAVFARRDEWVTDWDDEGQAAGLKGFGAELIRGHGRLDGHRRVAVATPDGGTVTLTARQAVVICTGSRPALPELAGLAEARPWTNRKATDSRTVPGRLAIVGGGGVGVEMASAWQGLGAQVTLLAQADGLLSRMEPFAGELVGRGLAEAGVDVRIGVTVTGIRRPGGAGPVTLTLEEGGEVEADEVLFATGRQPLTDDIGLDTIGLLPGSWLEVDDTCRVVALEDGWLYALGDINRHALLTHQGKYQARIATAAIAARAAGQPVDTSPWGRTGRTPHPRRRRRPRPGGAGGGPARRRLHRPCPHGRGRRPWLSARRHVRRPRGGRADPLGHRRRGRPGPGQPALARRPLLSLHQRGLAPPARGLPAGRHR
jgi:pyruvate/2-oxoglutarate dehydrogenase complex dihydrolipoamide dehydrogenase (E3) component